VSFPFSVSAFVATILVAAIAVIKIRKALKGWKVKPKSIFVVNIICLGIVCYFILNSFFIGIPILYVIIYAAAFLASQFGSYHYADRCLSFWKQPDDSIYSKGGLAIHIVYIISVVLRTGISFIFIGSGSFQFHILESADLADKSEMIIIPVVLADTFMVAGMGLLIGLNRRLMKRYRLIEHGKEKVEIRKD
jgi:hypothetical protein